MKLLLLRGKASESLAHVLSGWSALARKKQAHSKAQCFLSGIVLRDAYKLKAGRLSTSVVFTCGSKAIV